MPRDPQDTALEVDVRRPHDELWFRDGNVVLVAETTCFRVHGSILSRSSTVFRDMMELATPSSPSDDTETMAGCPIVPLTDTAHDLAVILSLLYNGYQCHVDLSKAVSFATVKAMVTLGYKYQLDAIRDEGVTRLEICFPEDGEDFHNGVAVVPTHAAPESFHGGRPIELKTEDAISVVTLARKFDIPHLLPTAVYTAAQSSITALVEATTTGDLSPEDLILILKRRDGYIETQHVHFWTLWESLRDGKCPKDCISKLWRLVYEHGGRSLLGSRPNTLDDSSFKFLKRGAKTLCKKCMQTVLSEITPSTEYKRWDMLVEDVYFKYD